MVSLPKVTTKTNTYHVEVSVTRNGMDNPVVKVTTNGESRDWTTSYGTNHIIFYLAIIECLSDAIATRASHAEIHIGDQVARRQLNGIDEVQEKHMRVLHQAVKVIEKQLSGVEYL